MCLIAVAIRPSSACPLVVCANRDELYARPSAPISFWKDAPDVFAGRDLQKGGTWLGVTKHGKFAAITNVRAPTARREGKSRGEIVKRWLTEDESIEDFARALDRDAYPAFNLLYGTLEDVRYLADDAEPVRLTDGVHALSNARLDVPWPKVERAKSRLREIVAAPSLDRDAMLALLADDRVAPDAFLPDTGVPRELERMLSSTFIAFPAYGTRSSTVLVARASDDRADDERSVFSLEITERTYDAEGKIAGTSSHSLVTKARA